jgi:hypothetical protein
VFRFRFSSLLAVHMVNDYAVTIARHCEPVAPFERPPSIFVTALPVLSHGRARKFVVLGVAFIGLLLVDDMQNCDAGSLVSSDFSCLSSSLSNSSGTFTPNPIHRSWFRALLVAGQRRQIEDTLASFPCIVSGR